MGDDVTFTFSVKSTKRTSTTVQFNAAQQFDIGVCDANDRLVCRWGAGHVFARTVTTRSLATGEPVTPRAHRSPPAGGQYHAMDERTSMLCGAVVIANVQSR